MARIRSCDVFEYGITRPFPFRHFTLIVAALGVFWFAILTLINIVSQGILLEFPILISQGMKLYPYILPTLIPPSYFGSIRYGLEICRGRRRHASPICSPLERVILPQRF